MSTPAEYVTTGDPHTTKLASGLCPAVPFTVQGGTGAQHGTAEGWDDQGIFLDWPCRCGGVLQVRLTQAEGQLVCCLDPACGAVYRLALGVHAVPPVVQPLYREALQALGVWERREERAG